MGFLLGLASYFLGGQLSLGDPAERWLAPAMALVIAPLTVLTLVQFRHTQIKTSAVFRAGLYATLFGAPIGGFWRAAGGGTERLLAFYSLSSQVITGLLIALVIEAWRQRQHSVDDPRLAGVYYILLGLIATLVASLPWTPSNGWITYGMLPIVVGCLNAAIAAFFLISADLARALNISDRKPDDGG